MSIKMLVLSLTGQCNFACRYCYAAEHDRSMMSAETALAAVKLAADGGELMGAEAELPTLVLTCR